MERVLCISLVRLLLLWIFRRTAANGGICSLEKWADTAVCRCTALFHSRQKCRPVLVPLTNSNKVDGLAGGHLSLRYDVLCPARREISRVARDAPRDARIHAWFNCRTAGTLQVPAAAELNRPTPSQWWARQWWVLVLCKELKKFYIFSKVFSLIAWRNSIFKWKKNTTPALKGLIS